MKSLRTPFRLFIGFLPLISLLLLAGYYAYDVPQRQAAQGAWVSHTREVQLLLDNLHRELTEAELHQGKPLGEEDIHHVMRHIKQLQALTKDNSAQQLLIPSLHGAVKAGAAKNPMSFVEAHKLIAVMEEEEAGLLSIRTQKWQKAQIKTKTILLCAGLMLGLMVVAIFLLLYSELERRRLSVAHHRLEAEKLQRIVDVQHAIALHGLDVDVLLNIIAEQIQALTHADGSIIELVEGDSLFYHTAAGTGSEHIGLRVPIKDSLSGMAVLQNQVLIAHDTEQDSRVNREACRKVGLRSMVVVPLQGRQGVVGVLKVLSARASAFGDEDMNALELLAGLLTAKIEDAMTLDNIKDANTSLAEQKAELQFANVQLEELASTDALTGLKNQRSFRERLQDEFQRAKRYGTGFSLILMDVDHFKTFNDTFGHLAGDDVLRSVGRILRHVARSTDCVARYGGEEFAIILPETAVAGALIIAERLRVAVAEAHWDRRPITVSVGLGVFSAALEDEAALIEITDQALYAAKHGGRNQVRSAA